MDSTYGRFAGWAAVLAAIGGLLYSISFVILTKVDEDLGNGLASFFLLLGGLLGLAVTVGLYRQLAATDPGFALLGLVAGAAGAIGSALHGAYDLANLLHKPGALPTAVGNLPNPVDPRGAATFLLSGLAVGVFAVLLRRGDASWRTLATLGIVLAILLVVVYLARLIILTPTNPAVLLPAAVTGFLAAPAWYLLLGLRWLRK